MNSPDFSSLISGILSNPEMLSGIMNAVSALNSSGIGATLQNSPKGPQGESVSVKEADPPKSPNTPQNPALEAMFSDHAEPIKDQSQKDSPSISQNNSSKDRRALLYALKPFLGEKRGEKIDFILKVLALLDAAEGFNKFKQ